MFFLFHYQTTYPLTLGVHLCGSEDKDTDLDELPDAIAGACAARDAYAETASLAVKLCKPKGGSKKKAGTTWGVFFMPGFQTLIFMHVNSYKFKRSYSTFGHIVFDHPPTHTYTDSISLPTSLAQPDCRQMPMTSSPESSGCSYLGWI